ncbi:YidB family protein [bacterium]|nr:YidB family protein [bacterium]
MDLMQLGTQLLSDQLGLQVDADTTSSALSSLLGDGQGSVDFAGLATKIASSGELGNVLSSWLGDGANQAISPESILSLLGDNNVADFASKVGTDSTTAASGLADMLPQVMDKASSGGSLLESVGGLSGLMGAASSFLK